MHLTIGLHLTHGPHPFILPFCCIFAAAATTNVNFGIQIQCVFVVMVRLVGLLHWCSPALDNGCNRRRFLLLPHLLPFCVLCLPWCLVPGRVLVIGTDREYPMAAPDPHPQPDCTMRSFLDCASGSQRFFVSYADCCLIFYIVTAPLLLLSQQT